MGLFDAKVEGTDYGHERRHTHTVMDGMVVRWQRPGGSSYTGVSASCEGVVVHGTGVMAPASRAWDDFYLLLLLASAVATRLGAGQKVTDIPFDELKTELARARALSEVIVSE